jgi:chromosome partitioning protein
VPSGQGDEVSTEQAACNEPISHERIMGTDQRAGGRTAMRSVAVTNAKGGVGKSTTTINLAAALAELDRRVLLIDADPSGNATLGFLPTGRPAVGLADVLLGERELVDVVLPSGIESLDLVPPGNRLGSCSDQMGGSQGLGHGREFRVRRLMRTIMGYEVVLIDTSPVQTPLNVAILYAVDEVLIPIDPCVAALAGVRALEDLVRDVSEFRQELTDAGPLAIAGVLITRADRTLVSRQVEAEVRAYFGSLVFERAVPMSVKFREAYARGLPLIHYDRFGVGAMAYRAAAEAFLLGARGDGQGTMHEQGQGIEGSPDHEMNHMVRST